MALLTFCIHEVNDKIFEDFQKEFNRIKKDQNLKDSDITITFDDGLYSQWKYKDKFHTFAKDSKKIYFISTNIVNTSGIFNEEAEAVPAAKAHLYYFDKRWGWDQNYMSWDMIRELNASKNTFIGLHGCEHLHPELIKPNKKIKTYKTDIDDILSDFKKNLPEHKGLFGSVDEPLYWQPPYNIKDEMYNNLLIYRTKKDLLTPGPRIEIS